MPAWKIFMRGIHVGSLITVTSPPIMRASLRVIARPCAWRLPSFDSDTLEPRHLQHSRHDFAPWRRRVL